MNRLSKIDRPERRRLEKIVQNSKDKQLSRRCHAILLVHQGFSRKKAAVLLSAARSSVNKWCKAYDQDGIDALQNKQTGRPATQPGDVIAQLLFFLIQCSPQDFNYQRSRWSSELLAIVLRDFADITIHSSTLRRWLPELGIVWRRAAPTLHIKDPHKEEKMAVIQAALDNCSPEHPVFYEDEVDIHLNSKIGSDWSLKGKQKRIPTPGKNAKHYLAGSLHAKTGNVLYVASDKKNTDLFIAMLEKLKRSYRKAKTITLILDNYIIHKSKKAQKWLKRNPKFNLLFQPVYSPWVNKIEQLWHALHETITRNHSCKEMFLLLKKVKQFMNTVSPFPGGKHGIAKVTDS